MPTTDQPHPLSTDEYARMQAEGMTEARFQSIVVAAAQRAGWMVYHTHDSRRSEPGYPDLHLVHETRHLSMMRELKTEKGRISPTQKRWIAALDGAGVDVGVWRPMDWFTERITKQLIGPSVDEIAKKLGVELMPWQRDYAERVLRGERVYATLGRCAGWSTVQRIFDEVNNPSARDVD